MLVGAPTRLLATVTAHNADRASSLTTYDGVHMRAIGVLGGATPYNAWVRGGRAVEVAPKFLLLELQI